MEGFKQGIRRLSTQWIPLEPKVISKVMKYADKVMSEKKIQAWLDLYSNSLYWAKGIDYNSNNKSGAYIYPHEFLYLITNATDRLSYV